MDWKFDGEILQVREQIPREINIDIREEYLTIYYTENKFIRFYNFKLSKEEILKLMRYLLSIG